MVYASGISSKKKRTEKNQHSRHRLTQGKIPKIKTKNNSIINRYKVVQTIALKSREGSKVKKQNTQIPGLVHKQDSEVF